MNRILKLACLLGLCGWLCTACIRDSWEEGGLIAGDVLPTFSIQMKEGDSLKTTDFLGNVGVIVFFNTQCKDCQQELPVIQRIYEHFGSRIRLVGISREEDEASVSAYWKAMNLTFPYSPQPDREVYALFAKSGIPRIYLVDRTLTIRQIYTDSPLPSYDELFAAIEDLF